MWAISKIDWKAYKEGFDAWDAYLVTNKKPGNPYEKDTDQWYSWNKGWNENDNECKLKAKQFKPMYISTSSSSTAMMLLPRP